MSRLPVERHVRSVAQVGEDDGGAGLRCLRNRAASMAVARTSRCVRTTPSGSLTLFIELDLEMGTVRGVGPSPRLLLAARPRSRRFFAFTVGRAAGAVARDSPLRDDASKDAFTCYMELDEVTAC